MFRTVPVFASAHWSIIVPDDVGFFLASCETWASAFFLGMMCRGLAATRSCAWEYVACLAIKFRLVARIVP